MTASPGPWTSAPTPAPTRIGSTTFTWGERTFVMGILNVTPDSFSGDGLLATVDPFEAAVAQARRMVDEGADLLDVGGESTRPGHADVTAAEERARVIPVIEAVRAALPRVAISVDTTKAEVAEAAIGAGADAITNAVPSPCSTRPITSTGRPGAAAHRAMPTALPRPPQLRVRWWPSRSPRRPAPIRAPPEASTNATTSHWMSTTAIPRSPIRSGKATLSIESSDP